MSHQNRVHINEKKAVFILQSVINYHLDKLNYNPRQKLIVLCIGTDRSTGDALGPLTGSMLKKYNNFPALVKGDIHNPVHASNLDQVILSLNNEYPENFTIAVDAGLGKKSSVGYVDVKKGPLHPGTGVNKELTAVGNMHITGLVNIGGYMEYLVLQSTRLSLVFSMAETIAAALTKSVFSLNQKSTMID